MFDDFDKMPDWQDVQLNATLVYYFILTVIK